MHHFFISPEQIQGEQAILTDEAAHQVRQVLRMRPGDGLVILDNSGAAWQATITALDKRQVMCQLAAPLVLQTEPRVHLTLYCGLPKKDKFEWILQKGTEIGVGRFVPLITARTMTGPEVSANKLVRWRRIITEAAEQSRRARLPELAPVQSFEAVLDDLPPEVVIAYEDAAPGAGWRVRPMGDALGLFIGPEGGFTPEEVAAVPGEVISLGPRILRSETAALVAAARLLQDS